MNDQRDKKIKDLKSIDRKLQAVSFVRYVSIVTLVLAICFNIFFKMSVVFGDSMYPTIKAGSFALNSSVTSKITQPNRFDIVVVQEDDRLIIKRVVALPNETVQYKDNKLYINGSYVEEPFLDEDYMNEQTNNLEIPFTNDFGPTKLGDNEYFVLGDNRRISKDSRILGPIPAEELISHDVFIIK